jgi:hypothetical protein
MVGSVRRADRTPQRGVPTSKLGAAGSAREGNHIANVRNACDEHQHAFKTQAET